MVELFKRENACIFNIQVFFYIEKAYFMIYNNKKGILCKKEKKEGVMWNLEKQILMIYQK